MDIKGHSPWIPRCSAHFQKLRFPGSCLDQSHQASPHLAHSFNLPLPVVEPIWFLPCSQRILPCSQRIPSLGQLSPSGREYLLELSEIPSILLIPLHMDPPPNSPLAAFKYYLEFVCLLSPTFTKPVMVLVIFLVFSLIFRRKMERFRTKWPPCSFRNCCKWFLLSCPKFPSPSLEWS